MAAAARAGFYRVATANSVPRRRRSERTSKPEPSSRARSERRVRKRRWGESGSKRRSKPSKANATCVLPNDGPPMRHFFMAG